MTPADAARILEVSIDTTPEQLEARFLELRAKLEDKIAKAPTPGLKEKYRATLAEITEAFETLTLAADSSHLPVLHYAAATTETATPSAPTIAATVPHRAAAAAAPAPRRKSVNEFAVVVMVAVLLLAGGGWWVVHARKQAAERARIEAEAQARAKAEAERIAKLSAQLAAQLAESKVEWDAHEAQVTDTERRASDLKSEIRDIKDPAAKAEASALLASHQIFADWLKTYLVRHPAKIARVRAEQFLSTRAVDEARGACETLTTLLAEAGEEIAKRRAYLFDTRGTLQLESEPTGLRWRLVDTYGRTREGVTPATITGLPLTHAFRDGLPDSENPGVGEKLGDHTTGTVLVTFRRAGWEDQTRELRLSDATPRKLKQGPYAEGVMEIASVPSGLPWEAKNDLGWTLKGSTPATVKGVPPGRVSVSVNRPNYSTASGTVQVVEGESRALNFDHRSQTVTVSVEEKNTEIWIAGRMEGRGSVTLTDRPPGDYPVQLRLTGYPAYGTRVTVKPTGSAARNDFSFRELSAQKHTCTSCEGAGRFARSASCSSCDGRGRVQCSNCSGSGTLTNNMAVFANALADGLQSQQPRQQTEYTCGSCSGRGRVACDRSGCSNGTLRWNESCDTCGGDGRRSLLDMSS